MKNLFILFCLCFTMTILNAQESTITITHVITENKDGSKNVESTMTREGKVPQENESDTSEDISLADAMTGNSQVLLSRIKDTSSKVKAGPNGEGDVVIGKIPSGDFPPIILTTGDDPNIPDYPSNSFIIRYESLDDMKNNYQADLHDAISAIMK